MKRKLINGLIFGVIAAVIAVTGILWLVNHAHAAERPDQDADHVSHLVLSFGPTLNGNTNPKMASVGLESVWNESSLLAECRGIFSEELNGACEIVFSARVETLSGLFVRVGAGPAYYFRTDDRVSSNWNASLQAVVGLTQRGYDIGVGYFHYSNAGLKPPNLGRDFIGPVVEIKI